MRGKRKIVSVRPSPLASFGGIIGFIVMLIFGLSLLFGTDATEGPGDGFASLFLVIFVIFSVGGIIYYVINLRTFSKSMQKNIPITAEDVIEIEDDNEEKSEDFETKLRKLESLKRDGLLSEDEYQRKRNEILNQKW